MRANWSLTVGLLLLLDWTSARIDNGGRGDDLTVSVVNRTAILQCDNSKGEAVQWSRRYNEELSSSSSLLRPQQNQLLISRVQSSDAGPWVCSQGGRVISQTELVVLPQAERVFVSWQVDARLNGGQIEEQRLIERDSNAVIEEGDKLVLRCFFAPDRSSVGNATSLLWYANNGKELTEEIAHRTVQSSHVSSRHSVLPDAWLSELIIHSVDRALDGLEVACHREDVETSSAVLLRVDYPPTFTITRVPAFGVPVVEGMTVSLSCDAEVQPRSECRWLKDELPVTSSDGVIVMDGVTQADVGWYQCYVGYKNENYSSIGYFLNVKPLDDDYEETNEVASLQSDDASSDDASFAAKVEAPASITKSQSVVDIAKNVVYQEVSTNCSRPRIPEIHSVSQSPRVSVAVGGSARLTLRVCSNPKPHQVFWITPLDSVIRSKTAARVAAELSESPDSPVCVISQLIVQDVRDGDAGEYTLVAKNRNGLQDGSVWLDVFETSAASEERLSQMIICCLLLTLIPLL